jgi:hypothetical protein
VVPADLLAKPGQTTRFRARVFNARGEFLREEQASWAIAQGHLTGLYANGYLPHGLRWIRIAPSSGSTHLAGMLEALAKVFPTPVMPVGDLMQLEATSLPWGSTAVIVTGVTDAPLVSGVARLLEAGHAAVLILVGDEAEPISLAVPTYRVTSHRLWQALEGLDLQPAGTER